MTIGAARQGLDAERQKIRAERNAFMAFKQRVSQMSVSQVSMQANGGSASLFQRTEDTGVSRLCEAYEETVMAVGHYEEDYAEPLFTNLGVELSPEYAEVVRTESRLTPQLKQGILSAAATACQRRSTLIEVLNKEESRLHGIEGFISDVRPLPAVSEGDSFEQLQRTGEQLGGYETRTETQLTERQEHLHRSSIDYFPSNRISPKTLNEYLYESLETTYPALSSLLALYRDIQSLRREVTRSIALYNG